MELTQRPGQVRRGNTPGQVILRQVFLAEKSRIKSKDRVRIFFKQKSGFGSKCNAEIMLVGKELNLGAKT